MMAGGVTFPLMNPYHIKGHALGCPNIVEVDTCCHYKDKHFTRAYRRHLYFFFLESFCRVTEAITADHLSVHVLRDFANRRHFTNLVDLFRHETSFFLLLSVRAREDCTSKSYRKVRLIV